ncbi:MAG: hypothetical protein ABIO44_07315 [Saprospiraceae bacterium]
MRESIECTWLGVFNRNPNAQFLSPEPQLSNLMLCIRAANEFSRAN